MKTMNKRGVAEFATAAKGLGIAALIIAVVLMVLAEFKANTTDGNATAAIGAAITGIAKFPTWFGIVVIVIVGVFLFGLIKYF